MVTLSQLQARRRCSAVDVLVQILNSVHSTFADQEPPIARLLGTTVLISAIGHGVGHAGVNE